MELCYAQFLPRSCAAVFAFFQNPAHLQLLMGTRPKFRLLAHARRVGLGTTLWCETTLAGCVPVVLGFRHTVYKPPWGFGEVLIHGPFDYFWHLHEFHPVNGGTLVTDLVKVKLAWMYGGAAMTRALVAPLLDRVFALRHQRLQRLMKDAA
jgi:ligand-binding SRPBCC domain-containing protein